MIYFSKFILNLFFFKLTYFSLLKNEATHVYKTILHVIYNNILYNVIIWYIIYYKLHVIYNITKNILLDNKLL